MSFTEMCANRISSKASFINAIRVLCLIVISFGVITNIAGMDLGALWELSDFANILMVYCNLPLQYIGFKYVLRAWKHFEKNDGTPSPPKSPACSCLFGTLWPRNTKTNIITKKLSVAASRSHAVFIPYSPFSIRRNSASSITVTPNCCAFSSLLPASAPAMT